MNERSVDFFCGLEGRPIQSAKQPWVAGIAGQEDTIPLKDHPWGVCGRPHVENR